MDLKVERTMSTSKRRLRLKLVLNSSLIILLFLCLGQSAASEKKQNEQQSHSIDPINSEMSQNLPALRTHVREADSKPHAALPSTDSAHPAGNLQDKKREVRKTHHHGDHHNHHLRIQRQSPLDPAIDPTNSETNLPPKTVAARDSSNNGVESDDKMPFVEPFIDFPNKAKGKGRSAAGVKGTGEAFIDFPGSAKKGRTATGVKNGEAFIDFPGSAKKGRTATGVKNGEAFIDFPDKSGKKGKGRSASGVSKGEAFIDFPNKSGKKGKGLKGRGAAGLSGNGDDAFIEFPKNGGKGKGRSASGAKGNGEPFLDFPDKSGKKGKGRTATGVSNREPFLDFPNKSGKKGKSAKGRTASGASNGEPFLDFPNKSGKKGKGLKGRGAAGVSTNGDDAFIEFPKNGGKKGKGRTAAGVGNGDGAFIEFPKNGGKGKGRGAKSKGKSAKGKGAGEAFMDFPKLKKAGKGARKAGRGIGKKGKSVRGHGRGVAAVNGTDPGNGTDPIGPDPGNGTDPINGTDPGNGTDSGAGPLGGDGDFIPGDPKEGPYLDFDGGANTQKGSGNGSRNGPLTAPIPPCPKENLKAVSPVAASNHPDPNESTKLRIKLQDRHILLQAHKNAIFGVSNTSFHEPNNSVRILNLTGETFKKWCPEKAVPPYYVDHVVSIFAELHRFMTPSRISYITSEEVTWIEKILMWCDGNGTLGSDFVIDPLCRDDILGSKQRQPICTDPQQKFVDDVDPLLDTVLRIVELVHSACFKYFDGYARVWHRFMMAIEDLYNLPMRQRWYKPVNNGTYYERLLGPKYKQYSENLDKCAHFYGMETVLQARLSRFPQMYGIRYGPNVQNIFNEPTAPPMSALP